MLLPSFRTLYACVAHLMQSNHVTCKIPNLCAICCVVCEVYVFGDLLQCVHACVLDGISCIGSNFEPVLKWLLRKDLLEGQWCFLCNVEVPEFFLMLTVTIVDQKSLQMKHFKVISVGFWTLWIHCMLSANYNFCACGYQMLQFFCLSVRKAQRNYHLDTGNKFSRPGTNPLSWRLFSWFWVDSVRIALLPKNC